MQVEKITYNVAQEFQVILAQALALRQGVHPLLNLCTFNKMSHLWQKILKNKTPSFLPSIVTIREFQKKKPLVPIPKLKNWP
tara:strand:+ start:2656 stop:2901 length:246 start_codon:yes stop_codon:yes gene_type:complete